MRRSEKFLDDLAQSQVGRNRSVLCSTEARNCIIKPCAAIDAFATTPTRRPYRSTANTSRAGRCANSEIVLRILQTKGFTNQNTIAIRRCLDAPHQVHNTSPIASAEPRPIRRSIVEIAQAARLARRQGDVLARVSVSQRHATIANIPRSRRTALVTRGGAAR